MPAAYTTSDPKAFTLYDVAIKAPLRSFVVPKRYSDFVAFHKVIVAQAAATPPCALPPKHYFASTVNDAVLTEARRKGLEKYLEAINHCQDSSWRDTEAWRTFLHLPNNVSANIRSSQYNIAQSQLSVESDPALWLDAYRELKAKLCEARSLITSRAQAGESGIGQEASVTAKSILVQTANMLADLEKGLRRQQDEWGKKRLGDGEVRRRRDLLAAAREEREDMLKLLSTMARKKELDDVVADTRSRSKITASVKGQITPAVGKGRVLGKETSKTRELDNSGVLQMQKQAMLEQDEDIDTIAGAVRRQKELAIQINEELALQTEMLSVLNEDVSRADAKIGIAKRKIGEL